MITFVPISDIFSFFLGQYDPQHSVRSSSEHMLLELSNALWLVELILPS